MIADEEIQDWRQTNAWPLLRMVFAIPSAFGGRGVIVGAILWLMAAPFVVMFWILEIGLRFTLRSRIVAEFSEVAGDSDSTEVNFKLRGPCALMLEKRIKRALAPPEIPLRIRRLAGIALPQAAETATDGD